MLTDSKVVQDTGIAKIKSLLMAARPGLTAESRKVAATFTQTLAAQGGDITDKSPEVTHLMEEIKALRAEVGAVSVTGAAAIKARDLTTRALDEMTEALSRLADSYIASDRKESMSILRESGQSMKAAIATGTLAGKALGIAWPLR